MCILPRYCHSVPRVELSGQLLVVTQLLIDCVPVDGRESHAGQRRILQGEYIQN